MKVWITKYALTQGILDCDAEIGEDVAKVKKSGYSYLYFHGEGREWHLSEESAKIRANQMAKDKIESLKKQIVKLEKTSF